MGVIQSSINSMLGSASHAILAVRGYQTLQARKAEAAEKAKAQASRETEKQAARTSPQQRAADRAKQSLLDAIQAKAKQQRRSFREYLAKQSSSLGKIGDLPEATQKQIAQQYTPSQRRRLMDEIDAKEAKKKNGIHK